MHLEALPCNRDPMRVASIVESHFKDEIIEMKPSLCFSDSVYSTAVKSLLSSCREAGGGFYGW